MQCPICSFENKKSARFCAQCGAALQDEPKRLEPGQVVGEDTYRIVRPLGKGGMGAVYLAANARAFDRPCVVKEVIEYYDRHDPAEREKAMRQFECEARTLASLKHPGIPDIYAYFIDRGRNYLVMEYIEGQDLSEGLNGASTDGALDAPGSPEAVQPSAALTDEDIVRYAVQICDVLVYLSQCQPPVMHNDIKPGNIILEKNSGRAVLVDFGTAQSRFTRPATGNVDRRRPSAYGTMGYAAPELYEGKAEPRSDVYALAATVYHLLTRDDPRAHPFQFPYLDRVDEPLKGVLEAAQKVDVDERIDAAQFKTRLQGTLGETETGTSAGEQLGKKASQPTRLAKRRAARRQAAKVSSTKSQPTESQSTECRPAKARRQTVKLWPFGRAPAVEVTPAQIDLGRMSAEGMYTDTRTLTVQNRTKTDIECRLEGRPSWLTAVPETVKCAAGETEQFSLRGRAMGFLVYESQLTTVLQVIVEGHPRPHEVRVSMRPPASRRRKRKSLIKAAAVGLVVLAMAGLVTWIVWMFWPLL
jgi:serine/threonine protein kinase